MDPHEIAALHRRKPFEPFRLVLADGRQFDIRYSNLLLVGRTWCQVGIAYDRIGQLADEFVIVPAAEIAAVEPLPAPAPVGQ
jgi:hypothetical protein